MGMLQCKSVATWLDQFSDIERPLAVMTLERLRFVTTDEVKQDLAVALSNRVDQATARGSKIIIESILSKEDIERFLIEKGSNNPVGSRKANQPRFNGRYVDVSCAEDILGGWVSQTSSGSTRKHKIGRAHV